MNLHEQANIKSQEQTTSKKSRWSLPMVLSVLALTLSMASVTLGVTNASPTPWQKVSQSQQIAEAKPQVSLAERSSPIGDRRAFFGSPSLIADVAEDIAPSVVNIDVQRVGQPMSMSPFGDDIFQRFFGIPAPGGMGQQRTPIIKGNGSGVIINASGDVLTNNHVVQGADDIMVTLNDGRKLKAKVVGRDTFSDIAILKIQGATNLKPARLGVSKNLRPGEWVIAVGSPLGFDHTVTVGIVSALSRQVPDINANVEFIQTDAAINPGNSGGPLVNLNGEVVGINTAIAGSGQNIGFAIPVDVAKKIAHDLVQTGHVTRPWIGITMAELKPDLARSLGIAENVQGVIVAQVMPGSPAAKAGFQQGDILQRINGTLVKTPKEIQDLVRAKPLNSELSVQIMRNGQMGAVSLRTEALPETALNSGSEQGE